MSEVESVIAGLTASSDSAGALAILAGLVLSDGRRWGDAAMPWQWADARAVLGGQRFSYLTRPRGGSKTTDVAGIGIAALLEQLPRLGRAYIVAGDKDQGQLVVDAIDGFVDRNPALRALLKVDTWKVTARTSQATLEVLAADAAGAWGKLPHLLIVDERAQWKTTPESERLWKAMFSSLPKVPGSRLVVLTTGGAPTHPAGKLIERARRSPRWYVNEVPGPLPWANADDLAEQRDELTDWEYRRLHLNEWVGAADHLANLDDVRACCTLQNWPQSPVAGLQYVIGVDLGLTNDRTVCAVAHIETAETYWAGGERQDRGRRVVLDRMEVWAGDKKNAVNLDNVEAWIETASKTYNRAKVISDPFQAVGILQRLSARGVSVEQYNFNPRSITELVSTLHLLLRNHTLALPDEDLPGAADLVDELANVKLRETSPGSLRVETEPGRHDDRAIALGLAAHELLGRGSDSAVGMWAYKFTGSASRSDGQAELARQQQRAFVERHPDSWHARQLKEWDEADSRRLLARRPGWR